MTLESDNTVKQQFEKLSKDAVLDVSIPKSLADLTAIFENNTLERIKDLPARRSLFLDEQATVILILKTRAGLDEAEKLLSNLEVLVSAYATDAIPQANGPSVSASTKYDVASQTFAATRDVKLAPSGDYTLIIWKVQLHLIRPRARLQRPAIYFTASLTVNMTSLEPVRQSQHTFLESFECVPPNVLAPLGFDPALAKSNVSLSEDRITKIAPADPRSETAFKPIRAATKRAYPALPALFTRTRYTSLPDQIIASMHIETSRLVGGSLLISEVEATLSHGSATLMDSLTWPKKTRPGDEIAFMYKLQSDQSVEAGSSSRNLAFRIKAAALVDQTTPIDLDISWQTRVDLSQPMNKPSYKWSRPLSMSMTHQSRLSNQSIRAPSFDDPRSTQKNSHKGLTFTFTGPATVHQSDNFQIHIQCVNRSSRTRRFALLVLPPRPSRSLTLPPTSLSNTPEDIISTLLTASSVERPKIPDILDFNPDVRIGPLPSNASYDFHMKFRAMSLGGLDLGAIRIVDMDTRQTVDVRELPDIIATSKQNEGLRK